MKILLTGATGQLGRELLTELSSLGDIWAPKRVDFDLASPEKLRQLMRWYNPDLVVNPAAYTAVDQAENDADMCMLINAEAPKVLAEECARIGSQFIHFSTDYVFDGLNDAPYRESDPTNPLSVYGATKLIGEHEVLGACDRSLIVRTSWVYSPHYGKNFYTTMLKLFSDKKTIRVVNDQFGRPTSTSFLAVNILHAIKSLIKNRCEYSKYGIYHLVGKESMSWFEFACRIYSKQHLCEEERPSIEILPVSSSEFPALAARPQYSVLDRSKWADVFGIIE